MTRRSKAVAWIEKLRNMDIKTFEFNKLPEDVRDVSCFRRAITEGILIKIRENDKWGSVWEIKNRVKKMRKIKL